MFVTFGDVHGNWTYISKYIESYDISDMDIFSVGDFGIGFHLADVELRQLIRINTFLKDRNNKLYIVRGNHDSPNYFQSDIGKLTDTIRLHTILYEKHTHSKYTLSPENIAKEIKSLSNIKFVEDYSIIKTQSGDNVFCLGGAVSIDRRIKTTNLDYWEDEVVVFDYDRLEQIPPGSIDYVITHTTPDFCPPIAWNDVVYRFAQHDLALHSQLPHERANLSNFYHILMEKNMIKKWFYGHFHQSYRYTKDVTDFIGLNINEFYFNN